MRYRSKPMRYGNKIGRENVTGKNYRVTIITVCVTGANPCDTGIKSGAKTLRE